jgi:peroxiredoxin
VEKKTDTLAIGSKAPAFTLAAANPRGNFSLQDLIGRGPLVVEFLRGTW